MFKLASAVQGGQRIAALAIINITRDHLPVSRHSADSVACPVPTKSLTWEWEPLEFPELKR
jgi:hypothetical protein